MNKKVLLLILDGWGITQDPKVSAIAQANTPFIDSLYKNYPNAEVRTDGLNVGLPEGQMGNSEVGHMNLGAGRIVYQDLAKVNLAIEQDTLKKEPVLKQAFNYAKKYQKKIHFLGLLSTGGVHSHINHLKGLISAAHNEGLDNLYVHAFTDGRDVDPKSGVSFIKELQDHLDKTSGKIASVIGRYYAMDRDKRWKRVKKSYDLLVNGIGEKTTDIIETIENSYVNGLTDEFIEPIVNTENNEPIATIEKDDVVIFFNFRTPVVVSSETPLTSFSNSLKSLCIKAVRSPPSSKIILTFQSFFPSIVCLTHHQYSSSVSPFQAKTGTPAFAIAAAA